MSAEKKPRNNSILGVLFAGCMFIGMGAGLLTNHLTAGLFAGMGIGVIAAIVIKSRN